MHQKTTLENGLRVVTVEMPWAQSVCVNIFVGNGSRYERVEESGISHFIEHMLFRGTTNRATAREISEAIEGVGGMLNAGTDKEVTVYWCKVAKPHFSIALDVLVDMVRNSLIRSEDLERERSVILEEINMCLDSPSQRVDMLIDEILWPNHPMGWDIAGTRDSVKGITREMLLSYIDLHYFPASTVLSVAGDVSHEQVLAMVQPLVSGWNSSLQALPYKRFEMSPAPRLNCEHRSIEQANLCLALPGIPLDDPRRFAADLLNGVLGEGMSSRLFSEIRDRMGLAYSISSHMEHFLDTGSLTVAASVDPSNLDTALRAIIGELDKLRQSSVLQSELDKAREMAKGRMLLRMEDTRSVAGWIGGQEILSNEILTMEEVLAKIEVLTTEDLLNTARDLLVPSLLRLSVVGPSHDDASLSKLLDEWV